MDQHPEARHSNAFEPTRQTLWRMWYTFYFLTGGSFALAMMLFGYSSLNPIGCLLGFFLWPVGLGLIFWTLIETLAGLTSMEIPKDLLHGLAFISIAMGYPIFVFHLELTLRVVSERKFWLLMVSLVLLVSASLVGCTKFTPDFMPQQQ